MGIRIENLHFHLYRGLRPVGLRRDFGNHAIPLEVRIGIDGDYAFLLGAELGEIVLRDVEFDLKVVQVSQGHYQALRAAFSGAGKSRGDQFSFFCGALKDGSSYRRANQGSVEQRLGIGRLTLSLLESAASASDLLLSRADLSQLKTFFQRVRALLVGLELGGGVIESLLREHALGHQVAGAVEGDLVVDQRGPGFVKIVLSLLNFLGTRTVLQFFQIGARILGGAPGLFILGAEFVIFEADQDLIFFNLVSLFDADPLHSPRDLGVQIDLVVGHNVAAGGENHAANFGVLRRGADHFYFRHVAREQTIADCRQAQQQQQADSREDIAARPDGRFAFASAPSRAVDSQALQVFVFSVNRHAYL